MSVDLYFSCGQLAHKSPILNICVTIAPQAQAFNVRMSCSSVLARVALDLADCDHHGKGVKILCS